MESVEQKADRLFETGAVALVDVRPDRATATVKGDTATYHVHVFDTPIYTCNCAWGLARPWPARPCAHVLAVQLARRAAALPTDSIL